MEEGAEESSSKGGETTWDLRISSAFAGCYVPSFSSEPLVCQFASPGSTESFFAIAEAKADSSQMAFVAASKHSTHTWLPC